MVYGFENGDLGVWIDSDNITKDDILKYYNTHYTTDNICVCIVDSKNIETMISEYVNYFVDIPTPQPFTFGLLFFILHF